MNIQPAHDKLNQHLSYLEQDKDNINLLVQISDLYLETGDLVKAQNYLDKASAINREACLGHQGLLHINRGQFSQAKEHFLEALAHIDTPALRYNLGFTHFITYELEEAWNILSPILEGEHYPEAKLLMARILHRQDELEEAIDLVEEVLEHNPADAEASGLLALLYFDLNEDDLALDNANHALLLNPDNYDAQLVRVMLRLATSETTVAEVEHLLTIKPQDSRLWFALGTAHMNQGDLESAESSLQKAIEIYPDFYDCQIALGWCQLLNNHLMEAQNTYQSASEIVPELADSWGGLALVHALQEDFLQAQQLIKKSNKINPDCFLTEIAQVIYFNHKNPKRAKEHLINALKNKKISVSEKLAFIIEEMHGSDQLH
jgi:tetratricopeptide (TPR) repeat protein